LDSPPQPKAEDYSMKSEVDDAIAIMRASGARLIFGLSSGALIALSMLRELSQNGGPSQARKLVDGVVAFEPVFVDNKRYIGADEMLGKLPGSISNNEILSEKSILDTKDDLQSHATTSKTVLLESQYRQQISSGDFPSAMITAMFIVEQGPPLASIIPHKVWSWLANRLMYIEEKKPDKVTYGWSLKAAEEYLAAKDPCFKTEVIISKKKKGGREVIKIDDMVVREWKKQPTLREYAPTIEYDFRLVREMAADNAMASLGVNADGYDGVPVLLMSGTKSPKYLLERLPELEKTLGKNCERRQYVGEGHGEYHLA
jgi:hypothetical protein